VSLDALAHYLGTKFDTQLEKARIVYSWICNNISYDVESLFKGTIPSQEAGGILQSRSSVCAGYSNLFKELLDRMGVECQIINGYAKGYGWTGKVPDSPDHAWNAVKIDGRWYLVDSTWGAGSTNETRQFVKKFTNFLFFMPRRNILLSTLSK
jgi:transglutaminase/protease-like cytokinesis protein 3